MIPNRTELHSSNLTTQSIPLPISQRRHDQVIGDVHTQPVARHVLPRNLPSAIKYLDDQELERLIVAALAEQKRRGPKSIVRVSPLLRIQRVELDRAALTTGKLNAVRAAFKAGV